MRKGIIEAIGNTPLVELSSLSEKTGCRILAKCEHLNPGGSVKDRAALKMIEEAENAGILLKGGYVCEGSGGNTGVALAMIAAAKGYKAFIAIPEIASKEKVEAIKRYGAEYKICPMVGFTDANNYFHVAAEFSKNNPGSLFTNQFNNFANMKAHYEGTAPEIWR